MGLVLATLALLFVYGFFGAVGGKAEAQGDSIDCPNPSQVQEFSGTGDQQTELFDIATSRFRVLSEYLNVEPGPDLFLGTIAENERGESIFPEAPTPEFGEEPEPPNTGEEIVNATPGRYRLNINAASPDREYVVTVEECGDPSSGGSTTPSPSPSPSPSPAPKTPSPAPKTPSPAPKTPSPAPKDSGTLMNAGGPTTGPVPMMSDGRCPTEFPTIRDGVCYPQ